LENVLVPNFSKSRADITVRWILSRYSWSKKYKQIKQSTDNNYEK
jgi:hypothetical protein